MTAAERRSAESGAGIQSVHMFGFFKDDDLARPDLPTKAAPSTLTPWEHFERLRRHFAHWGDEITDCRSTRSLNGWFVGAEWVVSGRPASDDRFGQKPMWHMVTSPADIWPDFQPTTPPGSGDADVRE